MTEEVDGIEESEKREATVIEPVKSVAATTVDVNDVDASWDGSGTLDAYRQQAFAKLQQPGFGNIGKAKSDGE